MHHAAEKLRSGDTPIKVIAAEIGFLSRSHFSRAFREAHGLDPSAYRRQHVTSSPQRKREQL
jgi:AraC-like DNA-binding protein